MQVLAGFEFFKKNSISSKKMSGDVSAQPSNVSSGLVMSIAGGKKRAQPAAFTADDEDQDRKSERAQEIRDLEDGKNKHPKVINMKEQTAWHRGRLGKDSNAEQLIRIHQMGGSASMEPTSLGDNKAPAALAAKDEIEELKLSIQERARLALVKEARSVGQGVEGEEATLGLKIETGTSSSRAVRTEEEAYKEVKHLPHGCAILECFQVHFFFHGQFILSRPAFGQYHALALSGNRRTTTDARCALQMYSTDNFVKEIR